jgi:hypothetical protein
LHALEALPVRFAPAHVRTPCDSVVIRGCARPTGADCRRELREGWAPDARPR